MTPQSTLKTTPKGNHNKKQGAKSAKASPSAPVATYSGRGNQTIVRKSNDLIQNAMYSLSLSQQKLMLHIFAMIKPSDTELPRYEMSIYEFLKLCGVDPHNGSMYKQVKKNIEDIANAKVQWIRLAGTQKITMFRWLSSATIDEGTGKIEKDPCCCVGCGECVKACPTSAWTRQETKFYRVILGGRTGRQTPRTGKMFLNWATEDVVLGVLKNWQKFSAWVMDYKPEYLHGGHLIDRAGYKKFKEIILDGVELNPECLVAEDIFWHETEYRSNFNVKPVAMHHKAGPQA